MVETKCLSVVVTTTPLQYWHSPTVKNAGLKACLQITQDLKLAFAESLDMDNVLDADSNAAETPNHAGVLLKTFVMLPPCP